VSAVQQPPEGMMDPGVIRAWKRYRVMAYVVGVMLCTLVFVAMPLQYLAHEPTFAVIVAPIHGYLYLVYLVTGADLAFRAHWRLGRIVAVVSAGFVPGVAFVMEHRVTRQMREAGELPGPRRDRTRDASRERDVPSGLGASDRRPAVDVPPDVSTRPISSE
jgi:integral membrane protein